jgi:hypothetical protein
MPMTTAVERRGDATASVAIAQIHSVATVAKHKATASRLAALSDCTTTRERRHTGAGPGIDHTAASARVARGKTYPDVPPESCGRVMRLGVRRSGRSDQVGCNPLRCLPEDEMPRVAVDDQP